MLEGKSGDKPVVWGVLGVSHFALMAAIPAMQRARLVELRALASRSLAKAQTAAASVNVPHAYGSYEELLADPAIEAIYNPLPNNLRVAWSIKAARAGKHVLCEKPIAMNTAEADELAQVQRETGKLIAEAFMVRYHPQWEAVVQLIRNGRIGTVRAVQTVFSYSLDDPENIRNQKTVGGGALYDIGCYAINTARLVFGAEPKRAVGVCEADPRSGCDRLTSAILDFGVGHASFVVGTQQVPFQRVHIFGSTGHIDIQTPFNAPHDRPCKIFVDDGCASAPDFTIEESSDDRGELVTTAPANHYTRQWQAFSEAVRSGKPIQSSLPGSTSCTRDGSSSGSPTSAWRSGAWCPRFVRVVFYPSGYGASLLLTDLIRHDSRGSTATHCRQLTVHSWESSNADRSAIGQGSAEQALNSQLSTVNLCHDGIGGQGVDRPIRYGWPRQAAISSL